LGGSSVERGRVAVVGEEEEGGRGEPLRFQGADEFLFCKINK